VKPNPPANADARMSAAIWKFRRARAGCRERWATYLGRYGDEIDIGLAHEMLSNHGVDSDARAAGARHAGR